MSYRQTCHCGHDVDTHYLDRVVTPNERCACLASGCACAKYVNENEPQPVALLKRPNHKSWCSCPDCKAYDRQRLEHTRPTRRP